MNKYFGEWYFEDIISKINEFKLGTKIRSERGDVYNLSQAEGIGKQRKFSRWNGTKLRFMTYENIGKKFEILEDNTEEIEELDKQKAKNEIWTYTDANINKSNLYCLSLYTEHHIVPKINELVKAVNSIRKDKNND